ncbi:hypothetical protein [Caulobacter sp. RHG1]|uniref:hypothetical protein n=1 Tax=Caulobacter sp. (strain RHG1) TaxID=2545762 RepID=UPI0015529725|nr:hypothetical protein [Caulobacter sp. RHG1]NQE62533.1 hypothetical protein [Caulobacter sp. RHG1]
MALDAETQAFLDLTDVEVAPWTAARAEARDLSIPSAALPAVLENIALLKSQSALFITALGEAAGEVAETFQP